MHSIETKQNFIINLTITEQNQLILGDINGDNEINILDIIILSNYILSIIEFSNEQIQAADLNQDAIINILDIIQVVNLILDS